MTASNFPAAFALVLKSEGGYSNNPADPGGPTNLGITLATLRAYRGRAVNVDDVKNLSKAEAGAIYRANYWDKVSGDQLPPGVDYAAFDFAVNSGPSTAAKFLQRCLSVVDDGVVGQKTLQAVHQVRPADVINLLCDRRLEYLRALGTWQTFGRGWMTRIINVRRDALAMAANPIPIVPTLPPRPPPDVPGPVLPPKPASRAGFFAAIARLFAAFIAAVFPKKV